MFALVVLVGVVAVGSASPMLSKVQAPMACNPPTTDFVWRTCMDNPVFEISDPSISPYPVDPNKPPNVISFTYTITNGQTYESFFMDITLHWYGQPLLGKCDWHKINIPLNNLPGCKIINNCPMIGDGQPHQTDSVDLSSVIKVIEGLHKNTYHRIRINVKDDAKNPTGCLEADFMLI